MPKSPAPVVIYQASDFMEAAQLKSELQAAGILCEMLDSQTTTKFLGGGIFIGIRLIVPASQAQEAREYIKNRQNTRIVEDDQP